MSVDLRRRRNSPFRYLMLPTVVNLKVRTRGIIAQGTKAAEESRWAARASNYAWLETSGAAQFHAATRSARSAAKASRSSSLKKADIISASLVGTDAPVELRWIGSCRSLGCWLSSELVVS
jgi:hypothetical protein